MTSLCLSMRCWTNAPDAMTNAMLVDQAIYGAVRNGHGLRCASGNQKLASELADRLDLPDTAPPGADWSPFVSGFAIGDHYVVSRTFSDLTANRAGMVVTHALICRLEEIIELNDLRSLFVRLITSPENASDRVSTFTIKMGGSVPPSTSNLTSTAQLLVIPGSGPVVQIGINGFEQLVTALWAELWPSIRRRVSFRLSFGPKDIVEQPNPTIVCTPTTLIGRWHQYRVVGQSNAYPSHAASMIDGSDAGVGLRRFSDQIGANLESFDVLRLLEQACLFVSQKPDRVNRLIPAIRLIQRLSPDPMKGSKEKSEIVDRLVSLLSTAAPGEILTLRNLSISGFATSQRFWQAVELWFEQNNYSVAADTDLVQIVIDAILMEESEPSWRDAVKQGLKKASSKANFKFQSAFWRWSSLDARILPAVITLIHDDRDAVARMIEIAPGELAPEAAKPILATAVSLKLYGLHAVTASASMRPAIAARAQSIIEPGNDVSAMRLALRQAKPDELLDAVEEVDDARVLRLAAEATAYTPTLLAKRDMSTDANRRIWLDALKVNSDAWCGPADPRAAFEQLLTEQIEGRHTYADLLSMLSTTPLADVTAFPRRHYLWKHLNDDVRERLLISTVDAWFAHPQTEIEPELIDRILGDRRLDPLLSQLARGQFSTGLNLVSTLFGNESTRFRKWVDDVVTANRALSEGDADLLGRSVSTRGCRDTLEDLTLLYLSGRRDLVPALRHCTLLMRFWDRIWLGISPATEAEKWESFVDLAAELYPSGPDHNGLWERAGGKDSDLTHHGSGIGRWHGAVRIIQNGKKPKISKLVHEMHKDFGANQKLATIVKDTLFRR